VTGDSRAKHDLKRELDAALRQNHELHVGLRRYDEIPFLLRSLVILVARKLRRRLVNTHRRAGRTAARVECETSAGSFRPYRVRPFAPTRTGLPRVLHAVANFHTGGSARLVVDLIENLNGTVDQAVVVRDVPPRPHYVGLSLRIVPQLRSAALARRLLREACPDLVHLHFLGHHRNRYSKEDWDWYHGLVEAAADAEIPIVENVNVPVTPYFSPAVRCYVFVSDYVRTIFGRDGCRNVTIYPGSDLELFSRPRGADPPDGCIGMVYRLQRDKLDETAIEVFAEVLRQRPSARALIVGNGVLLETYRSAVKRAGLDRAVTFTGHVGYAQLPRLYEQMSVFVAPPHTESFGHVVPLAMGMRIPVAGYDVGALPEILGEDGVLVPGGDARALAGRVIDLLDDRHYRLRLGAANRERAERLFSVGRMVAEYRMLYLELLGGTQMASSEERAPAGGGGR
jgi:glycosyltransferase involved in cell wall biosynthesis